MTARHRWSLEKRPLNEVSVRIILFEDLHALLMEGVLMVLNEGGADAKAL